MHEEDQPKAKQKSTDCGLKVAAGKKKSAGHRASTVITATHTSNPAMLLAGSIQSKNQ